MSEGSQLAASPRIDVLPGYSLGHARLSDFAQVEDELARRHIAVAGAAAVGLPQSIGLLMIQAATDDVAAGRFKYGADAFNKHVVSVSFTPYLLFLSLRYAHPEITKDAAAALVTRENETKLNRAVLELFGYRFGAAAGDSKKAEAANGNGPQSSPPAASADSPGQTSPI